MEVSFTERETWAEMKALAKIFTWEVQMAEQPPVSNEPPVSIASFANFQKSWGKR